ncbi:MAG: peptidase MA family metallohydrolase, partial [Anaerolineae bacterium]
MRKGLYLFFLLLLAGLISGLLPVSAQEGITVTSNTYEYKFSENLVFRLVARSESEIEEITLFYKYGLKGATNRRLPEFTPGQEITAEHVERLQRGEIPPGSEIEYYWRIEDAAGHSLKTETVTFTYMDDRFQWQSLSQGQITLYWYDADQAFGQRLLDKAVESLARLQENVGVAPEEPIKIIVYRSKEDMEGALAFRGEIFEARITTLGTVVAPDIMLLHGTHAGVDQTIAHELSHVVVGLATDNPYGDIPAWLNEGLAMYNEGELRGGNASALQIAIREDRLHSVRSLTAHTGNPDEVNLWYGEVYSIVDFLLQTYGREKMAELLAVFKEGTAYDDALTRVYGFDQDELDARWRESLGLPPREVAAPVATATPEVREEPKVERAPGGGLCGGLVP